MQLRSGRIVSLPVSAPMVALPLPLAANLDLTANTVDLERLGAASSTVNLDLDLDLEQSGAANLTTLEQSVDATTVEQSVDATLEHIDCVAAHQRSANSTVGAVRKITQVGQAASQFILHVTEATVRACK